MSFLEPRMVPTTAPRGTMICGYSSSQRTLRSCFHEFQSKQPNWFVTTTWFGKLHQFFAPELPPCLASQFLQIANTQILQWWAQKKTFHKLDQPCCTATGFILGLYTWGKEVPIPGILCFRNNFSCYYSGYLQWQRPRRKTIEQEKKDTKGVPGEMWPRDTGRR